MGETAQIGPDDPVPLDVAVTLFFPAGGVTLTSLRTEIRKGNLRPERIAGKDFVTKRAIEEMRKRCRVQPRGPASISVGGKAVQASSSSSTDLARQARNAALASAQELREPCETISRRSTTRAPAKVIRGKF